MILDRKLWLRKIPMGRILGAQTNSAWTMVKIGVSSLVFVKNNKNKNNSDGKTSLKRQISPETTTDTQDGGKFY